MFTLHRQVGQGDPNVQVELLSTKAWSVAEVRGPQPFTQTPVSTLRPSCASRHMRCSHQRGNTFLPQHHRCIKHHSSTTERNVTAQLDGTQRWANNQSFSAASCSLSWLSCPACCPLLRCCCHSQLSKLARNPAALAYPLPAVPLLHCCCGRPCVLLPQRQWR